MSTATQTPRTPAQQKLLDKIAESVGPTSPPWPREPGGEIYELYATVEGLKAENAALRIQADMDSPRFKEMQDAGLRLEIERDELRERMAAAERKLHRLSLGDDAKAILDAWIKEDGGVKRDVALGYLQTRIQSAIERERDSLAAQVSALRAALEVYQKRCMYCGGQGWYARQGPLDSQPEQVQCEWCDTAINALSAPPPPVAPKEDLISPTSANVSYWTQRVMDVVQEEDWRDRDVEAVIRELLTHDTNACVKGVPMEVVQKMAIALDECSTGLQSFCDLHERQVDASDKDALKHAEEALALFEGLKNIQAHAQG